MIFLLQAFYSLKNIADNFFGKKNAPSGIVQHIPYQAKLILMQKAFIKKILVELYGDNLYCLRSAVMCEPGVVEIWPDEYKFSIINVTNAITDYCLGARGI